MPDGTVRVPTINVSPRNHNYVDVDPEKQEITVQNYNPIIIEEPRHTKSAKTTVGCGEIHDEFGTEDPHGRNLEDNDE